MQKRGFVYILSNQRNGTLYVWVTSNLVKRIHEHKNKIFQWFTAKYSIDKLMRFQEFSTIQEAIEAEKKLKAGNRKSKLFLIERDNPNREEIIV